MAGNDYDVIVIGSGTAGLSAAVTARDAGASVLICEAGPRIGGSSAASGGIFLAAGTEMQRRQGIQDTPDALFEHYMVVNKWELEPAVVRRFADDGASGIEWLQSLGVEFMPEVIRVGQSSVPRGHVAKEFGYGEVQALHAAVTRGGVEVALKTRVENLLTDDTGRVIGVRSDGTDVRSAAVVVACGGLGNASPELLKAYWPDAYNHGENWHYYIGADTNRGDSIMFARDVDAEITGYNCGLLMNVASYHGALEGPQPGWPVLVNRRGRRFVSEVVDYSVFAYMMNCQPEKVCFGIFDHDAFTRDAKDPRYRFTPILEFAPGYSWQKDLLEEGLAQGKIVRADTLAALAEKLGIEPTTFLATMEEYNRDAVAGRDSHFLKDANFMIPIQAPPFYGMERRAAEKALSSVGMRINADARVYRAKGAYVPGLFAAGEASGGVFNHYVATGNSVANCVIFGRAAGRNAAAERLTNT